MKATAQNPADRFASARELRAALAVCLDASGGASKERDVTAASRSCSRRRRRPTTVSFASAPDGEAVPQPIGGAGDDERTSSDAEIALCEVEILEASGPIRKLAEPPPSPRGARRPAGAAEAIAGQCAARADAARRGAASPPVSILRRRPRRRERRCAAAGRRRRHDHPSQRSTRERAVALFDRGLELRRGGRYGEALDAWEKALALAPDNRIYQANVQRLRMELGRLRAETPPIDVASALRIARPTLGPEAGVGIADCSAWWRSTP